MRWAPRSRSSRRSGGTTVRRRRAAGGPDRDQRRRRRLGGGRLLRHAGDRGGPALRRCRRRADPGLGDGPLARPIPGGHVHPDRQPGAEGVAGAGPGCPGRLGGGPSLRRPAAALPHRHRPDLRRPGRRARPARPSCGRRSTAGELRVALLAGEPGVGKTRLAAEIGRTAARGRGHGSGRALRRGPGRALSAVRRGAAPLRRSRAVADGPSGSLRRRAGPAGARAGRAGSRACRHRSGPTPRPSATGCSTPSPPGSPRPPPRNPCCSCSTTSSGRRSRRCCCCGTSCGPAAAGCSVLGTYRDTELTHDHPLVELVADLRRQGGVERLSLERARRRRACGDFVEQAAGRTLDEAGLALARAVYEETEGNPFFVGEVLRHLAETGAVERREGGWTHPAAGRSARHSRRAYGRSSAGGSPGSPSDDQPGPPDRRRRRSGVRARRACRPPATWSEDALLAALEEAAEARSSPRCRRPGSGSPTPWSEPPSTIARPPPGRSRSTAARPKRSRRSTTATLDDYVPALAHHWAKASAPVTDTARAVEYARRAGDRALAQLAHDEAASYYASGLDLLDAGGADPADPRRLDLLIGRGGGATAGRRSRLPPDPARRRPPRRALGDAPALARAALANTLGQHLDRVHRGRRPPGSKCWSGPRGGGRRRPAACGPGCWPTLGLELAWEPDPAAGWRCPKRRCRSPGRSGPETLAHVLLARDYTITAPDNATERLAATTETAGRRRASWPIRCWPAARSACGSRPPWSSPTWRRRSAAWRGTRRSSPISASRP